MTRRCHIAVEAFFPRDIAVAQEQQAKLWQLRAAISLGRRWRDQGRRTQAHDLLAPVCGWFTEGFETPDLKEAKALLNQLTWGCRLLATGEVWTGRRRRRERGDKRTSWGSG